MRSLIGVSLLLLFLSPAPALALTDPLYAKLEAASLEILVDGQVVGSGWFVSPGGVGVTAAHLVRARGKLEVRSPGFGRMPARTVAIDLGHDLALFHVDRSTRPFPYLRLSAEMPAIGQKLYLFGAPLFRHGILMPGEIARQQAQFEWNDLNGCYTEIFPVSAMTPEGFSGGPWVDVEGLVVGLQSGMMAIKGTPVGLAFMSPVHSIAELLADQSDSLTNSLGASLAEAWESSSALALRNGLASEGLLVLKTIPGGPLAAAGIVSGDALLAIDGQSLAMRDELLRMIRQARPSSKALFTVRRKSGETQEIETVLAPRETF